MTRLDLRKSFIPSKVPTRFILCNRHDFKPEPSDVEEVLSNFKQKDLLIYVLKQEHSTHIHQNYRYVKPKTTTKLNDEYEEYKSLCKLPDGLYISKILNNERIEEIVEKIQLSSDSVKRRVKHFGYRFDYHTLKPVKIDCDGIPDDLRFEIKNILNLSGNPDLMKLAESFNQVTINEYVPGVGISHHVDTHSVFSDTIGIISLYSSIGMIFKKKNTDSQLNLYIPDNSLMGFSREVRYGWTHGIKSVKNDKIREKLIPRRRRLSLTIRQVIFKTCSCEYPELCDYQNKEWENQRLPTRL